jgi:hypothetical protein
MEYNILNLIIIGTLIYLIFRISKQSCGKQEKFESNYPKINEEPLRDKLKKELIPQLQNLRTGFDTSFDSITNSLGVSERIGCTRREQELINTGAIDPNALQKNLTGLVNAKKVEHQSRIDEMIRQVEQMIIQY